MQSDNVMNMAPTTVCHLMQLSVFFMLGIGAVIMKLQEFKPASCLLECIRSLSYVEEERRSADTTASSSTSSSESWPTVQQ